MNDIKHSREWTVKRGPLGSAGCYHGRTNIHFAADPDDRSLAFAEFAMKAWDEREANEQQGDKLAALKSAVRDLLNASVTPLTKARYEYLELCRRNAQAELDKLSPKTVEKVVVFKTSQGTASFTAEVEAPLPEPSGMPRIKQNVWGNWKAYRGNRRVRDFGTDEQGAREWLAEREKQLKRLIQMKAMRPNRRS